MRRWLLGVAALGVFGAAGVSVVGATTPAINWTGYLHGRVHNSYSR